MEESNYKVIDSNGKEPRGPHKPFFDGEKMFNLGRLLFGLIIIGVGLLTLAKTMGFIKVDLRLMLGMFWPIIVVIIGLSLISKKGWVASVVSVLVTVFVIWVIALMIMGSPRIMWLKSGYYPGVPNFSQFNQVEKCLRLIGDATSTPTSASMIVATSSATTTR